MGLFTRLAGFARPPNLVVGLAAYATATSSKRVDFFLARVRDNSHAGLARAVAALRADRAPLAIQTTETAFDKDQSSLTALDVRSLVDLGSLFTLLMSAAVIAIFTFGLILQRRREYVALARAGDARPRDRLARARRGGARRSRRACLRPPRRRRLRVPARSGVAPAVHRVTGLRLAGERAGGLVLVAVAAALVSAIASLVTLGRVRPIEILREP